MAYYHFIGIGGIGVGMLASLMLSKGHQVTGSDLKENDMTRSLARQGARIFNHHDQQNIYGAQFVVYSSAIRPDNPELVAARQQGLPVMRRAELLAELMRDQIGITVAGAHGKTTTTSMIANLLISAQQHPTVALGGVFKGGAYQASLGEGRYFVAEVDESDGTFLFFRPQFSVITNIDHEHLDFYQSWADIIENFKRFISQTRPNGKVIVCGEDRQLRELAALSGKAFMTYGFSEMHDVFATNLRFQGCSSKFDYHIKGGGAGTLQLLIPGRHNVLNALACISVASCLGLESRQIEEAFRFFRGVDRRFQIKGRVNEVLVVDDYGHHPTEIKATLSAARALEKPRIITVFQPHRYSRTKMLMDDFVECLSACEYLIITDIYAAGEPPLTDISAQELCMRIQRQSPHQVLYLPKDQIVGHLLKNVAEGDLILTLGAGDIYRVGEEFLTLSKGDKVSCIGEQKAPGNE